MDKIIIGKEEWCVLPDLGLPAIKARIDTGAKTSALHAFNIRTLNNDGKRCVRFDVHPLQKNRRIVRNCSADIVDRRIVKSSSGEEERRYVIRTLIRLGEKSWEIEMTLTNRDTMGYRMLIGREAINNMLIDPATSLHLGSFSDEEVKAQYRMSDIKRGGLNILLLGSNPDLYSNKRIMEAGAARGHKMKFVDISQCYMNLSSSWPRTQYRGGQLLNDVDAVIPRIKPSMTFYGCAVARQFQLGNTFCLNNSNSIARTRDKLRCLQLLTNRRIPMPVTGFAHSPMDTKDLINMVGGAPLVIKLLEGAQGRGVVLAETNKAAESVINAFKSLKANILVQEFIREADGKDLRCFVIGGKVVGSIQRMAAVGDFRANLHLGGSASAVKLKGEERRVATNAAKAVGLQVAGVDMVRSNDGPKVLEINSSPGLEGVEDITDKDIAGMMIECIEQNIRNSQRPAKVAQSL